MMDTYHYLTKLRPPEPGAVPREGLQWCVFDEVYVNNAHYWGRAVYNRKLTPEECEHYDMKLYWEVKEE